jgi:hypothetical protein
MACSLVCNVSVEIVPAGHGNEKRQFCRVLASFLAIRQRQMPK